MVTLCQPGSELLDERAVCSSRNHLVERWQIAELTDEEIVRMSTGELLEIVNRSSQFDLVAAGGRHDKAALRRMVCLARRTCRRQGY